ncbi:dipeptide ABC transporter ATP-binding protein [Virgibacillus pantothenticus]|uniref:Peptide ABC transporter ATPase n=1 Tax=Virgibacillus pantothenticus TaxID=1473 RepID=A0A0L0QL15_VIRPA|nr:dipeptide ABC transporter ATP-binding protein [Virgibacillus pantothenticus]KNE18953.1 peptide ABC transporter ATPase [Virgibacillus pantothenticus]MBU8565248.1 dipeptide ABC transporter ATP-binding protein [Virgibacillus pantothenticus]MBU8599533.1 dipeptide ABC transporter ATP-binding protein [Virgibacillus pantothenticus]MBU8633567.1 dipeptide ABC transporter ATP-binding protein [Virgibacillus pantothenticus]MBU8641813.1 dipeptide ABC transporter ATP-binding protein [Virgibacillus pantot
MTKPLLEVKGLKKYFEIRGGVFGRKTGEIKAVDDVSFTVREGEILGIVGESGCGKSTTGKSILRLIEPSAGEVTFAGRKITHLDSEELRKLRKDMQIIFQDPYASLNPRHTVEKIIGEPLLVHGTISAEERKKRVKELLKVVGLSSYHASRYPHQFSGGQRQRIGIARALANHPQLIICDEPVSALDVSVQSQILNLMQKLREEFQLTYVFIAHDLSVVKHISDRVGVMYLGGLMELADKDKLYEGPKHPYTQALLSAVPTPDPDDVRERIILKGDVPSPANPPTGCVFHTRCPQAMDICKTVKPAFEEVEDNHFVACHLFIM